MPPRRRMAFQPHPWHGIAVCDDDDGAAVAVGGDDVPSTSMTSALPPPAVVNCFIECTPNDGLKYEIDKASGFLKVDRPHRYSSMLPYAYGFLPQTYCAERTANVCMQRTALRDIAGDGDPLDVVVLSTRLITHGNVIVRARPIGGLRMIDGGEADDKIIAVIDGHDLVMSAWSDIDDVPRPMLDALRHYFLTYKHGPDDTQPPRVRIVETYGRGAAHETIAASRHDYKVHFGAHSATQT